MPSAVHFNSIHQHKTEQNKKSPIIPHKKCDFFFYSIYFDLIPRFFKIFISVILNFWVISGNLSRDQHQQLAIPIIFGCMCSLCGTEQNSWIVAQQEYDWWSSMLLWSMHDDKIILLKTPQNFYRLRKKIVFFSFSAIIFFYSPYNLWRSGKKWIKTVYETVSSSGKIIGEQINNNKIQHLLGHYNHSTRIHKMK